VRTFEEVEVQNTLNGGWSSGFEVVKVERDTGGEEVLRLRRRSDGYVLPAPVSINRVRATKTMAAHG
jgi:hypothetical protein